MLQKNCIFDSIDGRKSTSQCNAIVVAVVTSAAIAIGTGIAITATRDNNSDNCALLCFHLATPSLDLIYSSTFRCDGLHSILIALDSPHTVKCVGMNLVLGQLMASLVYSLLMVSRSFLELQK